MAKIIAAEQIKLDSVIIEKNANGKLVFDGQVQAGTDVTESLQTRLSTAESTTSDLSSNGVGSIETRLSTQESDQDSTADSLQTRLSTQESDQDSVADSLQTRLSTQESDQDSVADSLQTRLSAQESDQDSVADSLASALQTIDNNIRVSNYAIASGASSITCNYSGFSFSEAPKIVGMIKNGVTTDPIMVCQLRSVSAEAAVFDFSDEIAGGNYSMDVILTVEPHQ